MSIILPLLSTWFVWIQSWWWMCNWAQFICCQFRAHRLELSANWIQALEIPWRSARWNNEMERWNSYRESSQCFLNSGQTIWLWASFRDIVHSQWNFDDAEPVWRNGRTFGRDVTGSRLSCAKRTFPQTTKLISSARWPSSLETLIGSGPRHFRP